MYTLLKTIDFGKYNPSLTAINVTRLPSKLNKIQSDRINQLRLIPLDGCTHNF